MKTTSIKKVFGSLAIATVLVAAPSVFAADVNATTSSSVRINSDGIIHVVGAEVTSISGDVVNAITRFKNSVVNWSFTTNASTTINTNPTNITSSTSLRVGDKLNVTGLLSSFGTTIGVSATKIMDMTSFALAKGTSGTVTSVSTSTGTFVIKEDDKTITVQTNASTTFARTGTSTPQTFSLVTFNSKVKVTGTANTDGTIITATNVLVKMDIEKNRGDNRGNKDKKKENNGAKHALKNGWKDKEDRDNSGKHEGFIKADVNLGLGLKNN